MTQKMCDKAVDTYPSATKFVSEWFMTQEMCDEAVDRCFLYLILSLIGIKLEKFVTELFLRILSWQYIYCLDKYTTERMCDKGAADSLAVLKLFSDWFVTSEMIEKIYTIL